MRHRKKTRRLGRKSSHRKATLKNLARALLIKESIKTTKVKAKETQSFIDNLITLAKDNTSESKRQVFSLIRDKGLIDILFNQIAPRFKERTGGYTRIIPLYPRRGDGSSMALLELIEKRPKAPKKVKKEEQKKEVKEKPEEKKEQKVSPEPKADIKEEIQKEKAKKEEKKVKKGMFLKNLRRFFRGKAP